MKKNFPKYDELDHDLKKFLEGVVGVCEATSDDGEKIMFVEATSLVVHHGLIRECIEAMMPQSARKTDGKVNFTDSTNFHSIFHNLKYSMGR